MRTAPQVRQFDVNNCIKGIDNYPHKAHNRSTTRKGVFEMTQSTEEIQEAANAHYVSRFTEIGRLLKLSDQANDLGHYEWQEEMRERLEQMPLCVDLQTINVRMETCEWEILLGTGGPADRVLVTTSYDGDVEDAVYQYQDWFTQWTDAQDQDSETVIAFANAFYFSPVSEVFEAGR